MEDLKKVNTDTDCEIYNKKQQHKEDECAGNCVAYCKRKRNENLGC